MHIRPKQIGTNLWLKILLPRNEKGSYILICYPAQTNIKHLHVIGNRIWGVSTRAVCDSFCYVLQAKLQKLWKAQNITCKQLIIQKRTNSRKFFVNMYMKNWQQNYRNSERFKYSKQTTVSTVNALSLTHALFKYVYEKLTALTRWLFNFEGAETFVWREWIRTKASQYIYQLSADLLLKQL